MSGVYINGFGSEGTGPGQFKHPRGITTDSEGFILVADSGNNRIQVFRGNDYAYITSFGGMGTDSGKFRGIEGITCNNNGDVVIADKENHRIQIM
jgi:tripartite motif-containing protein 71